MHFSQVKVKGLKPRVDVFTKKLHNNMTKLWKDATREFIRETIPLIHVDTGMSRMSVAPLARLVRMLTVVKAFSPVHKSRKGFTDINGNYDPKIARTAALGEKLGKKAFTLNFGTPGKPVFNFRFDLTVYQYDLHEDEWQSLERGQEAFINYLRENAVKYVPPLAEWLLPEN